MITVESANVENAILPTQDVEEMYETAQEMLGGGDWAPDLLYFSSGAWDSGKLGGDPGNWTFARFDQGYGRMFDLIAQKCDPKRQVRHGPHWLLLSVQGRGASGFGRPLIGA